MKRIHETYFEVKTVCSLDDYGMGDDGILFYDEQEAKKFVTMMRGKTGYKYTYTQRSIDIVVMDKVEEYDDLKTYRKKQAALRKLTPEEKELLGIKVSDDVPLNGAQESTQQRQCFEFGRTVQNVAEVYNDQANPRYMVRDVPPPFDTVVLIDRRKGKGTEAAIAKRGEGANGPEGSYFVNMWEIAYSGDSSDFIIDVITPECVWSYLPGLNQ